MALVLIAALELLRRPAGLEPSALVPIIVVAATSVGGFVGGALAAAAGSAYAVFYYAQPAWAGMAGNGLRVATTVIGSAFAVWLIALLRDRREQARVHASRERDLAARVQAFTLSLTNESEDSLPEALVRGASDLLDTEMAVLTILDPHSGRHFVRAVHGGGASALGIEVIPGVGITGQALRERRTVVAAPHGLEADGRGQPRVTRAQTVNGPPQVVASLPAIQQGRVIATLTVGRSDPEQAFDESDLTALDLISPLITLAVSGQLLRQELEQGSPRDAQTGLYNRPYLDAALEQLLALRKRLAPPDRPPLSMIMLDIDSFRLLNDRHGRQLGDAVLRAVATLLRQRFRASDILARVGPDSFFVVLNGASSEVAAEAAAQIRRQVRELNISTANGEPVVVSISAGCAVIRDGERPEALFRSVEAALDTARWSGPGAVVSI
jgi:diguanylate cyclase (GGDEF)-like protein